MGLSKARPQGRGLKTALTLVQASVAVREFFRDSVSAKRARSARQIRAHSAMTAGMSAPMTSYAEFQSLPAEDQKLPNETFQLMAADMTSRRSQADSLSGRKFADRLSRTDRRFTPAGARLNAPAQGAQAVSFLRSRPGRSRARLLPPPPIWSRLGLFGGSLQSRPPISIIAVQSLERRCNRRPGIAFR